MRDIDIVITWVDGADAAWLQEKNNHLDVKLTNEEIDSSANRYRNWDNLKYLFRGIELYMPWVRKVHFITNGQKPAWLNVANERLNWVRHDEYMPAEYLPTFSSHPIELNVHRIPDLAEKFIMFNDDTFVIAPTKPTLFFKDETPRDQVSLWRVLSTDYSDPMPHIMVNNSAVINQHFNVKQTIAKHPGQWFSLRNSITNIILTAALLPISRNKIPALYYHHLQQSYLKSTFRDIWEKEPAILDATSRNKFRSPRDVSHGLMKYWQIMSGGVEPINLRKRGYYSNLDDADVPTVERIIRTRSKQLLCLNDARVGDFEHTKKVVNTAFEAAFSVKSEFEL